MAAGEERLKLVLDAIDKTAAPIRAVNRRIERMTRPVRKVRNAFASLAREARLDKLGRGALKLGKSLGKAAFAATAFAAVGLGVALGRAASSGITAAAAYESLGVRLKVLTGNAEGARQVLEGVDKLATRTPFSLEELGNTAASMAVIFKDNTDRVGEFTSIASDLAAAYGKPVEQIGENLQRAFSAGLGSADVLREAGISAEIMRITGASKVSEVSAGQLAAALRKMTREGGPAFGAAAEQAETLQGSISNTQIALGNVTRSLGQALAPIVNEVLLNRAIPAFERLRELIDTNREAIGTALSGAMARLRAIWEQLSTGFAKGFASVRGLSQGSGDLAATFSRLSEIVAVLFEKMGGWEAVGEAVGVVFGFLANTLEGVASGIAVVLELVNKLTPALAEVGEFIAPIFEKAVALYGDTLGGVLSEEGAVSQASANIGGRIAIELDDRRARVVDAQTSDPGVELDLAGGEALGPA